jgi:hypothetical protein
MLHSHAAIDWQGNVKSFYDTNDYDDPLAGYSPWNKKHQVGKFRYDITQCGQLYKMDPNYRIYIGFSSTKEPNVYDNNYYCSTILYELPDYNFYGLYAGKPPRPGTHWNIEERNLKGVPDINGEVAGAMGWYLPTLKPNESTSLTVALMLSVPFFHEPNEPNLSFGISDDMNQHFGGIHPNDFHVITIKTSNQGSTDACGVFANVYLSPITHFYSASDDYNYSPGSNKVTYNMGTLLPGETRTETITFQVDENAVSGSIITTKGELYGSSTPINSQIDIAVTYRGDLNFNKHVNFTDFAILGKVYDVNYNKQYYNFFPEDTDNNGVVNLIDVKDLVLNWLRGEP